MLLAVACNAYDPSLLDGALGAGAADASGGGSAANVGHGGAPASSGTTSAPGGKASGGAAVTGSGGAPNGNGGARASGGNGGTPEFDAGAGGLTETGNRGGAHTTGGVTATGGVSNTGGTGDTGGASERGGTSSQGGVKPGYGGTANGGTTSGGTANGGTTSAGTANGGTGSAGTGSAGTKATGGATGSGGSTSGGSNGSGGSGEACSGCARLSVPLTMSADRARFALSLPSQSDFTGATLTLRVARLRGTGGTVLIYLQDGGPNYGIHFSDAIKINSLSASMQNIVWNIGDASGNATAIERIGIEVVGTGGSPFTNPTVLYLDRIDVAHSSLAGGSWTFDTSASVYTTPTSSGPVDKIWLNSYSADTNVSGATISWLGP